ncbi:MAG: pilus assembly protein [Litoreibacter sp.]|nr:pilus assembly protein [Boseongicola sp.]NNK77778.1 pilus assembly protein [Litoreibacter sp.]
MLFGLRKFATKVEHWVNDERGTATIEAVLWIPLYVVVLTFIADVSAIYHNQAQVMRIMQDGNRQYSVGRLASIEETEAFIEGQLAGFADNAVASTEIIDGVIHSSVSVPSSDLDSVGTWARINDITLVVRSQHLKEF